MREIRADGDSWRVSVSRHPPAPETQAILFFPTTCDQRPYRVVEVDESRIRDAAGLEALSERELQELFEASVSMNFPHHYA